MKDITTRNVDDTNYEDVKKIAKEHGHSMAYVNKKLLENGYEAIVKNGIKTIK